MNKPPILSINSYCLLEIFNQIKIKCENENRASEVNAIKYADLIQFVISLEWFRVEFSYWDIDLYKLLEIENYVQNKTELTIDFDDMYKGLQKSKQEDRNIFWKLLITNIKNKKYVQRVNIKYTSGSFNEEHLEVFDMLISALQNKRFLRHLDVDMKGYTLENLQEFRHLEELHLNVRINAEELVECCQFNPNLRKLSILNSEIYGRLSDITRNANNLRKLQKLDFLMKPDIDAGQYAPLARLPQLNHLRIRGEHEIGSLRNFLSDLSGKEAPKNLHSLSIDDAPMNDMETQAISQINSLQKLTSGFKEADSISCLSQINDLQELKITSVHAVPDIIHNILNILRKTKQKTIKISFSYGNIEYIKDERNLTWTFDEEGIDASEYAALCEVPNLNSLHIRGFSHKVGSLRKLFSGFANRIPQTLKHLRLSEEEFLNEDDFFNLLMNPINLDADKKSQNFKLTPKEISEVAAIKSLHSLACSIADVTNIDLLGQLVGLVKLTMILPNILKDTEIETLKRLFSTLASRQVPRLEYLDISGASFDWNVTNELLKITSLMTLSCSFADAKSVEILQKLIHLNKLEIRSKHEFDTISQSILGILSSSQTEIRIYFKPLNASITYNRYSKELKIDVSEDRDLTPFGFLGRLEPCHCLIINGKFRVGSLYSLLDTLSKENNCIQRLVVEDTPINFQESLLLSQITSLREIIATFLDDKSFGLLHRTTNLEYIQSYDSQFPYQILNFLNNCERDITIRKIGRKIEYRENDGKLILENEQCGSLLVDPSDCDCLANLDNLQVLHIIGRTLPGSLKGLFAKLALRDKPILKELLIKELLKIPFRTKATINYVELLEIAKISSLRKLKCGFASDIVNAEILDQLKELEELAITTHSIGSLVKFFQSISSPGYESSLQNLSIEHKELTVEEIKAISGIKSLRKLSCILRNTENKEPLPIFPQLSELSIRSHRRTTLADTLGLFIRTTLRSLTVTGDVVDVGDLATVARHESLSKLEVSLVELGSLGNHLLPLNELKELFIENVEVPILRGLPIYPQNLRKLAIRNVAIDGANLMHILRLPELKSLECVLAVEENVYLEGLNKLEEFIVTPNEEVVKIILRELVRQMPLILKHFVIKEIRLDMEETQLLSQINSLTTLKCSFNDTKLLHCLTTLRSLEILEIRSPYQLGNLSSHLLDIVRTCTRLEEIYLAYVYPDPSFIKAIFDVLKALRDPLLQEPLRLYLWGFDKVKFELPTGYEQYLRILIFVDDLFESC